MKLATLKTSSRDGELVIVARDLTRAVHASPVVSTIQQAIENWEDVAPRLQVLYEQLNQGQCPGAFAFDPRTTSAPFPRAYQWLDGSAFMNHGRLMEQAFGLSLNLDYEEFPLMYQGGSDDFLGPTDDIVLPDASCGIDFEGELAVVVDDIPMGISPEAAGTHIRLLMLVNDVSLRTLGPREMASGFGFVQAKPSSSFAPVAITPDELGDMWKDGQVHLRLRVEWNGERFGEPHAGQMTFNFHRLITHAARTRRLRAGTIIGSGTVSNADRAAGSACISERRAIEQIDAGAISTGFMQFNDRVRIEMRDEAGQSIFGAIDQRIIQS